MQVGVVYFTLYIVKHVENTLSENNWDRKLAYTRL